MGPAVFRILFLCVFLGISLMLTGQSNVLSEHYANGDIPTIELSTPTEKEIEAEDDELGFDSRFARPIDLNLASAKVNALTFTSKESWIWAIAIKVEHAKGLLLAIDDIKVPHLTLFSLSTINGELLDEHRMNIHSEQKILLEAGPHEEVILNCAIPLEIYNNKKPSFTLLKCFHVYKPYWTVQDENDGFESPALQCHENLNCHTDKNVIEAARGVTRILRYFDEGLAWCTGTLMNNTRQDFTPYVLTAFHCIDGLTPDYDFWRFDFDYNALDCAGEIVEEKRKSRYGAVHRAGKRDSDFLLLELKQNVPASFNPFFLGWCLEDELPKKTISIHHPRGTTKKVSYDYDAPRLLNSGIIWNNQVNTPRGFHLMVEFDQGTQESGSSGSPLINEKGQVLGQLHGGNTNCLETKSYYGWIQKSWDQGELSSERLDHWLNPTKQAKLSLEGMSINDPLYAVSGKVTNQYGKPLQGITVELDAEVLLSSTTDALGNFYFTQVESGKEYFITPGIRTKENQQVVMQVNGTTRRVFIEKNVKRGSKQSTQEEKLILAKLFNRIYPSQFQITKLEENYSNLNFTIIE